MAGLGPRRGQGADGAAPQQVRSSGEEGIAEGERISSEAGELHRAVQICQVEGLCGQRARRALPPQALTPIRGGLLGWATLPAGKPVDHRLITHRGGGPVPTLRGCLNLQDCPDLGQLPYCTAEQSDPQRNRGSCPRGSGQRCEDGAGLLISSPAFFPQHTYSLRLVGVGVEGKETVSRVSGMPGLGAGCCRTKNRRVSRALPLLCILWAVWRSL